MLEEGPRLSLLERRLRTDPMRRIRNPRYAPEMLERRLPPAVVVPLPPVQVAPTADSGDAPAPDLTDALPITAGPAY